MSKLLLMTFTLSMSALAHAESASIKINDVSTQEDTSVVIKKGPISSSTQPEYEIVSGTEEIVGDPEAGTKEGYTSWKLACENWKKELKELNKENQVLTLNCNKPTFTRDQNHLLMYQSVATYKLKVRIRNSTK